MIAGVTALVLAIGTQILAAGPDWLVRGSGAILALCSALCFGLAAWRGLFSDALQARPSGRRVPWKILANLVLMLVAVVTLAAILFATP
jgi:hypothetical protein